MGFNNSETLKVGIVGKGSLANLLIMKLLEMGISINLLDSTENQYFYKSSIRYHNSLPSLARCSSMIITITSDGPELERILFSNLGIVNFITTRDVIVDMSSVSPELIQEISEQLIEKEIQFLDAALINEEQNESGLIQMILIGGDSHAYNKVLPVFQQIAKNVKHLGANGASQFYRQAFAVRAKKV